MDKGSGETAIEADRPWGKAGVQGTIVNIVNSIEFLDRSLPAPGNLSFEELRSATLGVFGFHPRHGLYHDDLLPFAAKFLEPVSSSGLATFLAPNRRHGAASAEDRSRAFVAALVDAANLQRPIGADRLAVDLNMRPGSLSVRNEVMVRRDRVKKRCFIDLHIHWLTAAGTPVHVGVEFKHGSRLSANQLAPYRAFLIRQAAGGPVLTFYVTPDGHEPTGLSARAWRPVSWFQLLRRFETYLSQQSVRSIGAEIDPFDLFRRQQWQVALGVTA